MFTSRHSPALPNGLLGEPRSHGDHHVVRHAPHEDAAVAGRRYQVLTVRGEPGTRHYVHDKLALKLMTRLAMRDD